MPSNEFSSKLIKTRGVCVTLWPCHLHLKVSQGKRKNYGNSNISPCKNIIFPRKSSQKRHQNPSRYYYYNSIITNLNFQHNLAKISSFKNPHIKIDLLLT
jgi:hypothetical protein